MKLGGFRLNEPIPELHSPHAFVVLQPWIDAGNVGTLALKMIETHFQAKPLGELSRPGIFFDFTRYRPNVRIVGDRRILTIPNTKINYAKRTEGNDLVFFHLMEPHMLGEAYTESILKVLRKLKVERYTLTGSMYDSVPHTRPLIVSGSSTEDLAGYLLNAGVRSSYYEGPTTITGLISQEARQDGMEMLSLIVHLPQYAQLENNYNGLLRIMEILDSIYPSSIDISQVMKKAERQYTQLCVAAESDPQFDLMIKELESDYENQSANSKSETLSPEMETFLNTLETQFDRD